MSARTAIIISCSVDEAGTIRSQAALQHRTISGYLLNILLRSLVFEEQMLVRLKRLPPLSSRYLIRDAGPRTTVLLRCSTQEAKRIRAAAKMRGVAVNTFVLYFLRHSWKVAHEFPNLIGPTKLKQD
jgi:uncharacterized protein (DUF1778 family)